MKYRERIIKRNNISTLGKSLDVLPGGKDARSVLQAKKGTLEKAGRSLAFGNY